MDNHASTIVVTEERKRRRGLVWVGLGAVALLSGGSTFALWSANDTFAGGDITAGDLNLVQTADTSFYDVSADRADATETLVGTDGTQLGHLIDDASWRAVPGDKVAAAFSADVTLEGDNLVGKLSVAGLDAMIDGNASMTWSYEVYNKGTLLVSETAVPADSSLFYLSAPATGQADGIDDGVPMAATAGDVAGSTVFQMTDTSEDVTVVLYGTFDSTAGDAGKATVAADGSYSDQTEAATGTREDALTVDTLAELKLQLDQVRDTGSQFD
ncbi:alternate-type signal peptide domain-containing protein [Microbacterium sp. UFMG61]|jgi:alternate signal-mediated exported protein|uniref:alternate-type signal peptide domain-containing protein n=1 Tax=Microbacterium sp. UFMG61 TaxID=2745935 RepID=UPI00188E4826|nr:alternate-type signal peptide domain-containing protein [Microbacterium sp. UFMG61]